MTSKSLLTAIALVSACAASAAAADLDGSVSLGGSYANIHGQKAKANEYRALGSGVYGGLDLNYRVPSYFLDFEANLLVNDGNSVDSQTATDNNFKLQGGGTDAFKFSLYYNEIPHNITYGARTIFTGVGTNALTTTLPMNSTAAAVLAAPLNSTFDYATNRTNYGAAGEISLKTPFFFLARVDRTEMKGLDVSSFSAGVQSGGNRQVREIPIPIDTTTDNFFLQTGYRSKNLTATLDGTISKFYNSYDQITLQQGAVTATNNPAAFYLSADNQFYKVGASVMYRMPFWSTTLMARASHSISQSSPVFSGWQSDARYKATQTLMDSQWNGYVAYDAASASITSNPTKNMDVRAYYNYLSRRNTSQQDLSTNIDPGAGVNNLPAQHSYYKNNAGLELGYKLPAATKLTAGYDLTDTKRSSAWTDPVANITGGNPEALQTTDHLMYVQVKNNLLDSVSGKVRYEHLIRTSEYPQLYVYAPPFSGATINARYFRRGSEGANKAMDAIKAELEIEPMHNLSLGLQYALKLNDYRSTTVGLQSDRRHELYADATYTAGIAKLNIYGEVEFVDNDFTSVTGTPWTAVTPTSYYWNMKRSDINYAVGTNVTVDIIKEKLKANVTYRFDNSEGNTDFTYPASIVNTVTDATSVDNFSRHALNTKLTYNFTKDVALDLGYMFEKLTYTDDQYTGYTYVPRNTAYALTGAFNKPDYVVNAFYTKLTYNF